MTKRILSTTDEVFEELGGTRAVALLTKRRDSAVSNWRGTGFPANTYVVMQSALEERGCEAPSSLWSMTPAASTEHAA